MGTYKALLRSTLRPVIDLPLRELGFESSGQIDWRRAGLELRIIVDSKAIDPYAGGAFTLEFERSADGRFGVKLAGRARFDQLLDAEQEKRIIEVHNSMVGRFSRPDQEYLELVPEFLRPQYLKVFEPALELGTRFWMRFVTEQDVTDWAMLLLSMLDVLVERAETIDPHELILGLPLSW